MGGGRVRIDVNDIKATNSFSSQPIHPEQRPEDGPDLASPSSPQHHGRLTICLRTSLGFRSLVNLPHWSRCLCQSILHRPTPISLEKPSRFVTTHRDAQFRRIQLILSFLGPDHEKTYIFGNLGKMIAVEPGVEHKRLLGIYGETFRYTGLMGEERLCSTDPTVFNQYVALLVVSVEDLC